LSKTNLKSGERKINHQFATKQQLFGTMIQ